MLFGEPYGVRGSFLAARGQMFSLKHLWEDLIFFDAGESVSSIIIPCCFMSGRYDLTVPGRRLMNIIRRLMRRIKNGIGLRTQPIRLTWRNRIALPKLSAGSHRSISERKQAYP